MDLTTSLQRDTVADLRPDSALVVAPDDTVRAAIALMQREQRGCVLICNEHGVTEGIFTERDVIRRVIGEQVDVESPINKVMSGDLATVQTGDPIRRAISFFHERGLRHLPVVDDSGKATGVLSVKRMVEYLVEHCPEAVYNLPPSPSSSMESREGA